MDNFFYTMNFTVSNLLLYGFLLLYSHICVGKPRKGWALATGLIILLIDLIFAIIPWVLYEMLSVGSFRHTAMGSLLCTGASFSCFS